MKNVNVSQEMKSIQIIKRDNTRTEDGTEDEPKLFETRMDDVCFVSI